MAKLQTEFDGFVSMPDLQRQISQKIQTLREQQEEELTTKRVVVLGTSHDAQVNGNQVNSAFEKRLRYLIEKVAVSVAMERVVREESRVPLCAGKLTLPYQDAGTPSNGEFQTFEGIINHPGYNGTLLHADETAPPHSEYGPLEIQENRENFMTQNVQHAMTHHDVGMQTTAPTSLAELRMGNLRQKN